jgi:hypothetical protein
LSGKCFPAAANFQGADKRAATPGIEIGMALIRRALAD